MHSGQHLQLTSTTRSLRFLSIRNTRPRSYGNFLFVLSEPFPENEQHIVYTGGLGYYDDFVDSSTPLGRGSRLPSLRPPIQGQIGRPRGIVSHDTTKPSIHVKLHQDTYRHLLFWLYTSQVNSQDLLRVG